MQPRPTRAEIDLEALTANYEALEASADGREVLAVVKANAYGHGSVSCARALEDAGARWLGVALVEEGVELRESGVSARILVLNGLFSGQAEACLAHDLTPVVYRLEHLRDLEEAAAARSDRARAHLKIDTGMGRVGVPHAELGGFAAELKRFPRVEIEGLLTHLADADIADIAYSREQVARFSNAAGVMADAGHPVRIRHFANSAATVRRLGGESEMVRPGIMLYGVRPAPEFNPEIALRPVMRFVTETVFVKRVPPGTPISYGRTFVTERESVIATLPVGYADGVPRKLSNRGEVLVRGARLPIIGRVCMDLTMIDATAFPDLAVGEEVVLIGGQGEQRISAEEFATWAETIDYEILCGVSGRVPRVYHPDGEIDCESSS
jgi:alanine racemase